MAGEDIEYVIRMVVDGQESIDQIISAVERLTGAVGRVGDNQAANPFAGMASELATVQELLTAIQAKERELAESGQGGGSASAQRQAEALTEVRAQLEGVQRTFVEATAAQERLTARTREYAAALETAQRIGAESRRRQSIYADDITSAGIDTPSDRATAGRAQEEYVQRNIEAQRILGETGLRQTLNGEQIESVPNPFRDVHTSVGQLQADVKEAQEAFARLREVIRAYDAEARSGAGSNLASFGRAGDPLALANNPEALIREAKLGENARFVSGSGVIQVTDPGDAGFNQFYNTRDFGEINQDTPRGAYLASRKTALNPEEIDARNEQVIAESTAASAKVAAAQLRVARADEEYVAALNSDTATTNQVRAAAARLISAREGLATAQNRETASGASGGGAIQAFGRGFVAGGEGPGGGLFSSEFATSAGALFRYTAIYQGFTLVEEAIKKSVEETLEFERETTNLALILGTSRDNARDLATQLGNVASAGGLSPSEGVAFGTQFARTFQGQAPADQLAQTGAQLGTQLQVLTGENGGEQLQQATAAVASFNLGFGDTQRVIDAATSAAQNFGYSSAADILPGLAQIGDLAQQAGLSLEQTANFIGDIERRTGETSDAAAGELRRVLGREGNAAFQAVFSRENIATTEPFQVQLEQLSAKFDKLSASERAFIVGQFGGGRAGAAALAILEDYAKVQDDANKTVDQGGIAQEQYARRINDVKGELSVLRGELLNLFKNIGETGIGAGLGIILETLKPALDVANQLLEIFNKIPAPLREGAFAIAEIALAIRGIRAVNIGELLTGIRNRAPAPLRDYTTGEQVAAETAGLGAAERNRAAGYAEVTGGGEEIAAAETRAAAEVTEGGSRLDAALQRVALVVNTAAERILAASEANAAEQGLVGPTAFSGARGLAGRGRGAAALEELPAEAGGVAALGAAGRNLGRAANAASEVELLGSEGALVRGATTGIESVGSAASSAAAALGPIGLAAIALTATFELYQAGQRIRAANDAADKFRLSGTTSNELDSNANRAANNAAAADRARSGILGGIVDRINRIPGGAGAFNAITSGAGANPFESYLNRRFFGIGEQSEESVAAQQRRLAGISADEARRLQLATSDTGTSAAGIDLSSQQGITTSLSNLANEGYSAGQQLDALTSSLVAFNAAAAGATNYIAPGQTPVLAQTIGNRAVQDIVNNAQASRNKGGDLGDANRFVNNLSRSQIGDLNDAVTNTANRFFAENNLTQGGNVTQAQIRALQAAERKAIVAKLEEDGASAKEVAAMSNEINAEANDAVAKALTNINGLKGQKLSQEQVGEYEKAFLQLVPQQAQAAGVAASLSGGFADTASAQAAVAGYNKDIALLRASNPGADVTSLIQARDAAQLQLNQAAVADAKAMGDYAASLVSPFDKAGALRAQLNTVAAELAVPGQDKAQVLAEQAQQNQLRQQLVQQQLTDQISASDLAALGGPNASAGQIITGSGSVQQALQAANDARATLAFKQANGATGSELTDAEKDYDTKRLAYWNAQVADQNASRDANVAIGDNVGQALAAAADALNSASTLTGGARAQALRTAAEQTAQAALAAADNYSSTLLASLDPRAVIEVARATLQGDTNKLRTLIATTPADVQAINAQRQKVVQDQLAVQQDEIDKANSRAASAAVDPRRAVEVASVNLRNAQRTLSGDLPGTAKYYQDLAAVTTARQALAQAEVDGANARTQAGVAPDNQLAGARASVIEARRQLSIDAQGSAKYYQDLAALRADQLAYSKAELDYADSLRQLRIDTTDPVAEARDAVIKAQQQLALDTRRGAGNSVTAADRVTLTNAREAAQRASFDQQLSDQKTAYGLQQESYAQYSRFLTSQDRSLRAQLATMKKGSEGYRQTLDELNQVDQEIQSLTNAAQGQFNLGDIKLPTVYEVRRGVQAGAAGQQITDSSQQTITTTINGADFARVVRYINDTYGPAAKIRTANTGRKVG